jgi:hypothetical protein
MIADPAIKGRRLGSRKEPRPYKLAFSRRARLQSAYAQVSERLHERAKSEILRLFQAAIEQGVASINMSIPDLNRFLKTGRWLNKYESVSIETGLKGRALVREVSRRLRELGSKRIEIDRILELQPDTHYSALNLGGLGVEEKFGSCCVVLDLSRWAPFHTCFSGDSIRACYTREGERLDVEAILDKFSVGENIAYLATVMQEAYLDGLNRFDAAELRDVIESPISPIEIHLHGPVLREHILEVRLARKKLRYLSALRDRYERTEFKRASEFDDVEPFEELRHLLTFCQIPLRVVGAV